VALDERGRGGGVRRVGVRARLDAHVHKTIATLRADGSPRICGTGTRFVDGDLWIGAMPAARKARDLQRDPRYALHSGSDDPPGWTGDAKVAGVAVAVVDRATVDRVVPPQDPARCTSSASTSARRRRSR